VDIFLSPHPPTTTTSPLSLHDALPISTVPPISTASNNIPAFGDNSDPFGAKGTNSLTRFSIPRPTTKASTMPATVPTAVSNNARSEEHTSELQSQSNLVCRLLLEKKKK